MCLMEQHVSTFLIGHHQAKHVLYNTQKEHTKYITTAERSPNIETPRPPERQNSESIWTKNRLHSTFDTTSKEPFVKYNFNY